MQGSYAQFGQSIPCKQTKVWIWWVFRPKLDLVSDLLRIGQGDFYTYAISGKLLCAGPFMKLYPSYIV